MSRELETKMPVQLRHSTDNAVNNMLQRATDSKADDKLAKEHVHPVHLTYKVPSLSIDTIVVLSLGTFHVASVYVLACYQPTPV